jgi:hypothetical protein
MIIGNREIIKFVLEINMKFRDKDGLMRREIQEGFINVSFTNLVGTRRRM